MSDQYPYKTYTMENISSDGVPVFIGSPNSEFYNHLVNDKVCSETYIFSSVLCSKNIGSTLKINSSSSFVSLSKKCIDNFCVDIVDDNYYHVEGIRALENDVAITTSNCPDSTTNDFIQLDTRWYYFRESTTSSVKFEDYSPTTLLKKTTNVDKTYNVEWRSLDSDGSVIIKPSLTSNKFWNGSEFISDEDALHTVDPVSIEDLEDDTIFMKTLDHIDVIRNDQGMDDSISPVLEKHDDPCLWQSSIIMKEFKSGNGINLSINDDGIMNIAVADVDQDTGLMEVYSDYDQKELLITKSNLNDIQSDACYSNDTLITRKEELLTEYGPSISADIIKDYNWIDTFEYNWLAGLDISQDVISLANTSSAIVSGAYSNIITVDTDRCGRQNKYYGIDTDGNRKHHSIMNERFSYDSTHKIKHDNVLFNGAEYPRYFAVETRFITNGIIHDRAKRVVVPPGVAFTTYKSLFGVHNLYGVDVPTRRPDEYHFAVDTYGNVFGEMNLPVPCVARLTKPDYQSEILYGPVPESTITDLVESAWEAFAVDTDYVRFGYISELDSILSSRITNDDFIVDDIKANTYINIHHAPIWVDVENFSGYLFSDGGV